MSAGFMNGGGRFEPGAWRGYQFLSKGGQNRCIAKRYSARSSPRFMRNRILSPAGTGARPVSGKEHFFDLAQVATF